MADVQRTANMAAKAAKKIMVSSLCKQIDDARKLNNGNLPHGFLTKLIHTTSIAAPNFKITRHDIRNMSLKNSNQPLPISPSNSDTNSLVIHDQNMMSSSRGNGGRPVGSTKIMAKNITIAYVAAKNEIATRFSGEKMRAKAKFKRLKKGRLDEIISQVKKKRNLPHDFVVSPTVIRKRVERNNLIVTNEGGSGQVSTLLDLEPQFICIVTQMHRIGEPLTPMKALALFNDLIEGTENQAKLKKWKLKHTNAKTDDECGRVGYKYFQNFKNCNGDKITTRKVQKFELDR